MFKRLPALGVALGLLALWFTGCGSTPTVPSTSQSTLEVLVGDVPLCNVLSFRVLVDGLRFERAGGFGPAVLSSSQSVPVDFAALSDTMTLMNTASVPPGTYTHGTLSVAAPSMTIFNPAQSPPIDVLTPTLSTETIDFNVSPPLVVTACNSLSTTPCTVSAIRLDFNLAQSIQSNSQGQISTTGSPGALTVRVTPAVTATPLTASSSEGFGEMDDVHGYILSVTPKSTNSSFIGSFVLQLLPGSDVTGTLSGAGPSLTVNLTSASLLIGAPALNQLTTGNFVEVDGYIDSNGNFVANTAMIEDREDLAENFTAFLGYILSTTLDANGNVTQFNLYVQDEEPNTSAASGNPIPLDEPPLSVNVSSSTGFHFSLPSANFASLTPDASSLAVGQQVVVHATYTPPPSVTAPATPPPATATAQDIYIPLQTVPGNYVSLLTAGSDNLTGAFQFAPCPTIFQGQIIYVFTNSETQFVNLNGLAGLAPAPQLLVRGLLSFDRNGGAINGVTVPPGSYVLLAKVISEL